MADVLPCYPFPTHYVRTLIRGPIVKFREFDSSVPFARCYFCAKVNISKDSTQGSGLAHLRVANYDTGLELRRAAARTLLQKHSRFRKVAGSGESRARRIRFA